MKKITATVLILIAVASLVVYVVMSSPSKSLQVDDLHVASEAPLAEPQGATNQGRQETDVTLGSSTARDSRQAQWNDETSEHSREVTRGSMTETDLIDIEGLTGRQGIDYASIKYLSSEEVLEGVLKGIEVGDDMWLNFGQRILQDRAQEDDGEVVTLLVAAIKKEGRASSKEYLVGLLGSLGTTHAVEALLEIASKEDHSIRGLAWYEIENIPAQEHNEQDRYREELSPILESAMERARTELDFYRAIIIAIARIGSEDGTELLLQEWRTARSEEVRGVVEEALMKITNPHAVPALSRALQEDADLKTGMGEVAGSALSEMADGDATHTILEWAAKSEGATMRAKAIVWLERAAASSRAFKIIREAGQRYEFRDPETKKEIENLVQTIEQE